MRPITDIINAAKNATPMGIAYSGSIGELKLNGGSIFIIKPTHKNITNKETIWFIFDTENGPGPVISVSIRGNHPFGWYQGFVNFGLPVTILYNGPISLSSRRST